MSQYPMPWEIFPTDVTSPVPSQLTGPQTHQNDALELPADAPKFDREETEQDSGAKE